MEGFISIATIVLLLGYIAVAIWLICTRKTVAGSIGTSAGFLCGGFVVISIAEFIATIVCWILVVGLVLLILGCFAN